jgi:hypothetical protein
MPVPSAWPRRAASVRARRLAAIGLCVALFALLADVQAVAAGASAGAVKPAATPLSVSPLPSGEVEEVLSAIPLKDLSATQLGEVLSQLPGLSALPTSPLQLQTALTKTIESLTAKGDTLGQLGNSGELVSTLESQLNTVLPELLSLLNHQSLPSVLSTALGSLDSSQMLAGLLSSAAKPEQLISEVLAAPSPGKLESLLGSTLSGEPFIKTTVSELANQAGITSAGLATDLDTTISQLPANAMALTGTLANGKTLAVLDGLDGLDLGVLGTSKETPPAAGGTGGSGGSGSAGGSGDSGGSGGTGGAGGDSSGVPAGTTTVVVTLPGQSTTADSTRTQATPAKVKILSSKVKGSTATIVVQVPAAGTLTVSGSGVKRVSTQADKAERVTLRVALTKARAASVHQHRRGLKVKLTTSFKAVNGTGSSTTTTVLFR